MVSAVIVAAGSSRRMGFDKLSAPICGKPVLQHSLEAFANCELVDEIIVVASSDRNEWIQSLVKNNLILVEGGAERHFSVWNGLEKVSSGANLVAIHDGARPLVSVQAIERCISKATKHGAATLANPVVDTLKRSAQFENSTIVTETVERDELWAMQTPQIFGRELIVSAYQTVLNNNQLVTDEVSAVQTIGHPVHMIENTEANFKITFPSDLVLAESFKQKSSLQFQS